MPKSFNPLFVVVEGMEAVGKSTVVNYLTTHLNSLSGLDTVNTREPGGTPLAEAIRDIFKSELTKGSSSLTQAHLIAAARSDHLDRLIMPMLATDKNVVCDRFFISTLVYQDSHDFLFDLNHRLVPDLTIVLTASPENVQKRLAIRADSAQQDWLDASVSARHAAMQEKMLDIVRSDEWFELSKNYLVVDTNQYEDVRSLCGGIGHDWELENYFKGANETLCYI